MSDADKTKIAVHGGPDSPGWLAASAFAPGAEIIACAGQAEALAAFAAGQAGLVLLPVYNTREGAFQPSLRRLERLEQGYWRDNVVLPLNLAMAAAEGGSPEMISGLSHYLRQAEGFLAENFPAAPRRFLPEETGIPERLEKGEAIIGPEELLLARGFTLLHRDIAPFNRTRFAVIGREPAAPTGYDATVMVTAPLMDRVGLLHDTLGEFSRRGVNLLDIRSDTDLATQRLRFYFEAEGHRDDPGLKEALTSIEERILKEPGAFRILGSFPRVDMRRRLIRKIGFIGTGDMSRWFADRLEGEGYRTILTGRTSEIRPEEMIPQVELVCVCVPISKTPETIRRFGPLLSPGQGLVILAGEAAGPLAAAREACAPEVEVMLVHNLWGPAARSMKDKNATVVRTASSGPLCREFEAFLHKHGANISVDPPEAHDLFMGFCQKLPSAMAVALAMTVSSKAVNGEDLENHATLTSMYAILSMARAHAQNPRTYAEIIASPGRGNEVMRAFAENLARVLELGEAGNVAEIAGIIEANRDILGAGFLERNMKTALKVDEIIGNRTDES